MKTKKHNFIRLFILALLITTLSCKDTVTGPPGDLPGRRDYVWTIDTLDASENIYGRMWGSSPKDVWTISSSNWDKSLFHFDGVNWRSFSINGMFNLTAIYGFSNKDIFVGADNGSIWRNNGFGWNLFAKLIKPGLDYFLFENIWGTSSSDFYAVGSGPDTNGLYNSSVIAHFSNNNWIMLNTDTLKGDVVHLYKNGIDNRTYFRLTKIGGVLHVDSTIIYEIKDSKYVKLYSSIYAKGQQADISLIDDEVYFILGNNISVRRNNEFKTILNVNSSDFYQRIWGRNSKDIFLLMTDGLVHYNGKNLEYLFHFKYPDSGTQIYGAALFDKEVFFLVDEPPTHLRLIYHGILK